MATCQGFAWSKPADKWGESRLEIEVTPKSSWFDFIPAIDIHVKRAVDGHAPLSNSGVNLTFDLTRVGP
jgi:hypothetical protein